MSLPVRGGWSAVASQPLFHDAMLAMSPKKSSQTCGRETDPVSTTRGELQHARPRKTAKILGIPALGTGIRGNACELCYVAGSKRMWYKGRKFVEKISFCKTYWV